VLGSAVGGGVGQLVNVVVGAGGQGYLLKFGRDQELEADKLGMRYMARAGYDPVGQRQLMQILADESQGGRSPEFLSTHPHPESRIEQIDGLLAGQYRNVTGSATHKLYEQRFRERFLDPVAALPPAQADAGERRGVLNPASWCALCAAR